MGFSSGDHDARTKRGKGTCCGRVLQPLAGGVCYFVESASAEIVCRLVSLRKRVEGECTGGRRAAEEGGGVGGTSGGGCDGKTAASRRMTPLHPYFALFGRHSRNTMDDVVTLRDVDDSLNN